MSAKKKSEKQLNKISEVVKVLEEIGNSTIIPKNIRRAALDAANVLRDETYTPAVRAANAISLLEPILYDPNMPSFARVKIWNVMGVLETIRD
ncbi:MAG: hypothetical protein DRO36_07405 [Candidatus Hecatellales archaeon]|nr:MAG: hypothetical protein DRO36_07405 [Candidatus Hecatellales archaeon]